MINNTQNRSIFRENSIKRFNSEDIQSTLKVTTPSSWCWVLFSLFLLLGVFIWTFFGRLAMTVTSSGIIIPAEYFHSAEKLIEENITERQSRLMALKKILDGKRDLFKKHYLTLTDLERAEQEYISAKFDFMNSAKSVNPYVLKPIFVTDKSSVNQDYYALLFVKNSEGKKINTGMDVQILPSTLSVYEYGYIKGKVVNISKYPVTKETAYSYLGNMNLVEEYFLTGSPFFITAKLETNKKTISGFAWTANKGPPFTIDSGSTVTAKIIHNVSTPFKLFTHTLL